MYCIGALNSIVNLVKPQTEPKEVVRHIVEYTLRQEGAYAAQYQACHSHVSKKTVTFQKN